MAAILLIIRKGGAPVAGIARVEGIDFHQPARVGNGQGAHQDRVNQGENRGVCADAQRQRKHRDGGEAAVFRQRPQAVAQVFEKPIHPLQ